MVYFILDSMPAYEMSWARDDTITIQARRRLVADMLSRPLPKYALRALVDVSEADWHEARKETYDSAYPLNQLVEERYRYSCTIFPFEVFELKNTVEPARPPRKSMAN
jgi:hypothetical protein